MKVDPEELGISFLSEENPKLKVAKLSISRPKPKKIFTPDSSLSAQEKIKLIMSGGLVEKKNNFLKGSYQELAQQFIDFLEENRIIRKRHGQGGQADSSHWVRAQTANDSR